MPDREKVIKGLQEIVDDNWMKTHADWYVSVCSDALALLKEQEDEISRITNEYLNLVKVASKKPEIVRCKDCKWWDKKDDSNYGYCHACKHGYHSDHWEIGIYRTYKGNWFCADGERWANNDKELSEENNKETGE